jgi:hypothetical protein
MEGFRIVVCWRECIILYEGIYVVIRFSLFISICSTNTGSEKKVPYPDNQSVRLINFVLVHYLPSQNLSFFDFR